MNRFLKLFPEIKNHGVLFVDLGSSGDLNSKWNDLKKFVHYIGFDPNKVECERQNQLPVKDFLSAKYYPYAIADQNKKKTLYLTKNIYCHSLLEPNHQWLKRFSFAGFFEVTQKEKIECKTLDYINKHENLKADILKLDIQGYELPVLKSGQKVLTEAFCVEIESGFTENYIGESIYAEIDPWMRGKGFMLFDFQLNTMSRNNDFRMFGKHQVLWGNSVWLKDYLMPVHQKSLNREKAIKALFICDALGYYDYGFELLSLFKQKKLISDNEYSRLKFIKNWNYSYRDRVKKILWKIFNRIFKA